MWLQRQFRNTCKWLKALVSNVLIGISRWLFWIEKRLNRAKPITNTMGYDDLAPTAILEKDSPYCLALQYAIENPKISNVALTGNYGSGKSSILESFKQHHPEFRYLNISLAVFDEKKHDKKKDHQQIEISILQQIFYHVKHRKIPESRFKRIRKRGWFFHLLASMFAVFTSVLLIFLLKPEFIKSTTWWKNTETTKQSLFYDFGLLLFVISALAWVFLLLRSMRAAQLSKLNLIKGEIEIEKLGDTSILNNYLDEILYFFEANSFDVVVIQDLDRFKEPAIFTKLREINALINNSAQINRHVTFIYAITDEMFKDATRPKFFEFILPVIPVINSSNSADIFFNILRSGKAGLSLTDNFINDMSLYVEDMRLLKNSINEYITYKALLDAQLTPDKLFSMILYKNLFPSDFAELPANKGVVYRALQSKVTLIGKYAESLENKIQDTDQMLKDVENERMNQVTELRLLYIGHILSKFPKPAILTVGGDRYPMSQLVTDDKFQQLIDTGNVTGYMFNEGNYHLGASFKDLTIELDPQGYAHRLQNIENKSKEANDTLRRKKLQLTAELNNQRAYTLADVLKNFKDAALPDEIKSYPWLSYLLRNGYIDETYSSYISFFYEGNITRKDRDYLFSIKNNHPLDPDHRLTNIEQLIKRIWLKEFDTAPILNYDMLDYLLQHKATHSEELIKMFAVIRSESDLVKPFLLGYYRRRKGVPEFFNELAMQWPGFYRFVYTTANFPDDIKRELLDDMLAYVDINAIKNFENAKDLIHELENDSDLLWRAGEHIGADKISSLITTFGLRFPDIKPHPEVPGLFDLILEHNAYQLNPQMIETIVSLKWMNAHLDLAEALRTQNYTIVAASGCEPLFQYIDSNINDYVERVLLANSENTKETEQTLLALLNHEHLTIENKVQLIAQQEVKISSISEVPEVLQGHLIAADKLLPTWQNVSLYFRLKGVIDETLAAFMSLAYNADALAKSGIISSDPDNPTSQSDLEIALLQCNALTFDAYKVLLASVDCIQGQYDQLDMSQLARNKVDELIAQKKIYFSDANWGNLKTHHAYAHIALAAAYPEIFMERLHAFAFAPNEFALLLREDSFTREQHFNMVEVIRTEDLTPALSMQLLSMYYENRKSLPVILSEHVFTNLEYIDHKIKYLSLEITSLAADRFVELLDSLGEPFNQLAHAEKSVLNNNESNLELVTKLKAQGFIQSFTLRGNEIKVKGIGSQD